MQGLCTEVVVRVELVAYMLEAVSLQIINIRVTSVRFTVLTRSLCGVRGRGLLWYRMY